MQEELGYNELADTVADLLEIADDIIEATNDGLQAIDALVIWQNFPKIKEIYDDRKQAIAELTNLTGEEAIAVGEILAIRLKQPATVIVEKITAALKLTSRTYRFGEYTFLEGKALLMDWKDLYANLKTA